MTYTDPAEKTAMARHSFAARASVVQAKAANRHLRAGRQSPVARAADRFIAGLGETVNNSITKHQPACLQAQEIPVKDTGFVFSIGPAVDLAALDDAMRDWAKSPIKPQEIVQP
jgi:phage gp37-like protein